MDLHMPQRIRKNNDTRVKDICEAIGISESAYRNKEKGINPWTFEEVENLAKFYGIDINTFIEGYDYRTGLLMMENKKLKERIKQISDFADKAWREMG